MRDRTSSRVGRGRKARRSFVMPGKDRFDRKNRRAGARSAGLDAAGLFLSAQGAKDAARAARIAELKAQIKAGTYRPDLEKVAERLLPDLLSE